MNLKTTFCIAFFVSLLGCTAYFDSVYKRQKALGQEIDLRPQWVKNVINDTNKKIAEVPYQNEDFCYKIIRLRNRMCGAFCHSGHNFGPSINIDYREPAEYVFGEALGTESQLVRMKNKVENFNTK